MVTTNTTKRKRSISSGTRAEHPTDDTFRAQLRAAGLKVTSGRVKVLRELDRAPAPVSHANVAAALAGDNLDKVTVWRILVALTEAEIVERTDVGDRTWRFELRNTAMGHERHPHFMCVSCKSVQCLPRESVRISPRIGRGVVDVQLKGRCERCL